MRSTKAISKGEAASVPLLAWELCLRDNVGTFDVDE